MKELYDQIIFWGRYAAGRGLTCAKSGNMSVRAGEGRMLITTSGSFLAHLDNKDCVLCPIDAPCEIPVRGVRPSMESEMHRRLYAGHPGAGAVFHSQPLYSTLFACTREPIPLSLFPESMAYIPAVVRIPYHHPGSTDLAEDVSSNLDMGEVGLLSNHGVIVAAASLEEAVLKTETMELMCRILYLARAASMKLEYLPDAVRDDFLAHLAHIRGYGKSHAG